MLLGEWLATEPDILIVDEPTRGIDVGTKQEIHRLLRQLARAGKAILVISSDLLEVLRVSDRIAVMREGSWSASCRPRKRLRRRSWSWRPGVGPRQET